MQNGRKARLGESAGPPLVRSQDEVAEFQKLFSIPKFKPMTLEPGQKVDFRQSQAGAPPRNERPRGPRRSPPPAPAPRQPAPAPAS